MCIRDRAYAKYSRGYKAGGFNSGITSPVVTNPYTGAEHNDAFEIGLKKDFGRTLQVNLAAFYYSYEGFQAPVTTIPTGGGVATAQTVFLNIPKAISKGFEALRDRLRDVEEHRLSGGDAAAGRNGGDRRLEALVAVIEGREVHLQGASCLLYTSDAADE